MKIDGYAFKQNAKEIKSEFLGRLEEIEYLHRKGEVEFKKTPDYKRTHFSGTLHTDEAKDLSEKDLFIIVTGAHIPFGGFITKNGSSFKGDIYDD